MPASNATMNPTDPHDPTTGKPPATHDRLSSTLGAAASAAPSGTAAHTHERCADCGAPLREDQRYCLRCGARRGRPRLDFTAFWRTPDAWIASRQASPLPGATAGPAGNGPSDPTDDVPTADPSIGYSATPTWRGWLGPGTPSRRATLGLAAGTLAIGLLAGAALGPGPASSPADGTTLAQRALAALIARVGSDRGSGSNSTASSPPTSSSEPTPTPTSPEAPARSASSASKSTASEPAGTSTEGSSTEGSKGSSEGSKQSAGEGKSAPGTPFKQPPVKHVWVIALSTTNIVSATTHAKTAPQLAKLAKQGTLLSGYTLSATSALGNGIALLSGQSENLDTEQNCPSYVELQPPTISSSGLTEGVGCVYPAAVKTLPDELTAAGLTWKAYIQGMQQGEPSFSDSPTTPAAPSSSTSGSSNTSASTSDSPNASSTTSTTSGSSTAPTSTSTAPGAPSSTSSTVTCRHPALGATDPNHAPAPEDPYLTYRNPFVYFGSLLESACATQDVPFAQLRGDLSRTADTPSFSWIAPSACDDGSAVPCAPGAATGIGPADAFIGEVVPQIIASAAYREGGLIAIVSDSAPAGAAANGSEPMGALLISPFVHARGHVTSAYNDFSLLKSISLLFGVLPLGHANDPSAVSFGASVYSANGKAAAAASTAKKAAQAASAGQPRHRTPPGSAGHGSAASQTGG